MATTILATYGHLPVPTPIVLDYDEGTLCVTFANGNIKYLNRKMEKPEARELYKVIREHIKEHDFPFTDANGNYQWINKRTGLTL